jgi:hypothetical protein
MARADTATDSDSESEELDESARLAQEEIELISELERVALGIDVASTHLPTPPYPFP